MIVRPLEAVQRRAITTYDLEWHEGAGGALVPFLAGAYDERGYRSYKTVAAFLRGELIPANDGRRFYAHFGGASDMVFLLRELLADERYSVRGVFSGSSAIVVTVERGNYRWTFVDSFWLMRVPLRKIGAWLGLPKLDMPEATASWAIQLEYNERDCVILYDALKQFEQVILDRGGQLCVTAASTALDIFKRRYLERPIVNTLPIDEWARPSYIASRVERLEEYCRRAYIYDINSSFPFSMTQAVPGNLLRVNKKLDSPLYIADVEVRVGEQHIPPLPYRDSDGRIYFPTGTMRTRLTSEDVLCGDFDILKVHSAWHFEGRYDMAAFAEDFFKLRAEGGFQSECYKIVLNSLYGKMAERSEKQVLLVRPKVRPDPLHSEAIAPHCYLVDEQITVEHSHVPISSIITARSRRLLRDWMLEAERRGGRVYYCDTDSIFTDVELEDRPGELGRLKLENTIEQGAFKGSKLYAYRDASGNEKVKAKGFSRRVSEAGERQPLTYDDFARIADGESIIVERMLRIRELLRREGDAYTPRTIRQHKELRAPRPKRKPMSDGSSAPWAIEELVA